MRVLRAVWTGRRSGPVLRLVLAAVLLPGVLNLFLSGTRPLGVLLTGAVLGSLYGLIAIGLILVYRANRVVNFAQAGLGAVPAVVALLLITSKGWPYLAVLPVLIVGSLALGAVVEIVLIRRFTNAPRLILAVVTIGVAQLLAYLEFNTPKWISGDTLPPNTFPTPFSHLSFAFEGAVFTGDHVAVVVFVAVTVVALSLFFRFTRVGVAVRAAAENADRAALVGIPVRRLSTLVWMLAALLSAMGIFLRAPLVGLSLGTIAGPSILLSALAAAIVARMERLPVAFAAGVGIGVIEVAVYYSTRDSVLSSAVMLPIILVALLLQRGSGSRALDTGQATWRTVREFRPIPVELRRLPEVVAARLVLVAAVTALALGLPFLVGPLYRNDASMLVIYALIGVSLVVLTGWAGQISLGQFAFVGVGAAVAGGLATNHHGDFFVTVLLAGLAGAAIAVLIGLPAVRVQGLFLAVTTLAFAAATQTFVLNRRYFAWLLPTSGAIVERPVLYGRIDTGDDLAFYYLCLAFLALGIVVARQVRASRSGRVMVAVRDNPRAAQAFGVNLARTRLAAFALSGFLAAVAGALFAYQQGAVDSGAFPAIASIRVFAMVVVGGLTSVGGAVAGAVYLISFERFPMFRDIQLFELLATGVGLMVLLLFLPGGLAELAFRGRDGFLRWVAARHDVPVPSLIADSLEVAAEPEPELLAEVGPGLAVVP
ncbi:MAG: ABC-type branched-chain amino acid transport system, permease component [Actinomycetia bacterium]|nr:ABC-type branched-chain amino acid transport system, permease component [Actinomycetes bacterium]